MYWTPQKTLQAAREYEATDPEKAKALYRSLMNKYPNKRVGELATIRFNHITTTSMEDNTLKAGTDVVANKLEITVASQSTQSWQEADGEVTDAHVDILEVWFPSGSVKAYSDPVDIAKQLRAGNIKGSYQARLLQKGATDSEECWTKVSELGEQISTIDGVLKPKMSSIWAWMFFGVVGGYFLKLIDTLYTTFLINSDQGFISLIVAFTLIFSFFFNTQLVFTLSGLALGAYLDWDISQINFGVLFSMIGAGLTANFSTAVIGAIFGGPLGMIIGSVLGHFEARRLSKKIELIPEGARPYVVGLLVPIGFLAIAVPAYIYAVIEILPDWLA